MKRSKNDKQTYLGPIVPECVININQSLMILRYGFQFFNLLLALFYIFYFSAGISYLFIRFTLLSMYVGLFKVLEWHSNIWWVISELDS